MSTEFSKAGLERMHEVMAGYVERREVPGLVTLVWRRGEVHADAIGTLALDGSTAIRRDTIFRLSSMTKPITAVAALMLIEECKLRLDDPADEFLPELANRQVLRRLDAALDDTVPAQRSITVRDLLTFRLGYGIVMAAPGAIPIADALAELQLGQGPPSPATMPGPDEWMRRLGTLPLMHQPGQQWMYNTGSDVLGVLIARASGQSFETFLQERLFDPLGMKNTAFSTPNVNSDRLATAYWTDAENGALMVADEPETGQWSRPPAFASGAAGLVSTVDDYLAFALMLLRHGRHGIQRLLSRPSVETMTTDQLTSAQKALSGVGGNGFDHRGWGFGVSMATARTEPSAPIGSYGWDGGMGTCWTNDPTEDMVTLLLTQCAWVSPVRPAVAGDCWTSAYAAIDD
ncbi:MAG: hypothetical protein JWL70_2090 [Acidimicrobiia bacterium]|nr:hypothetical protein [Acidimicrobiia bacterium]